MKKNVIILNGFVVSVFLFAFLTVIPGAVLADSFKVGIVTSISGPGYAYGKRAVIGIQYKIDQVNKAGGINGHPIELIIHDTATKPAEAAMLTERAATVDKVLAILGPNASSDVKAAFAVTKRQEMPAIALGGTLRGLCENNAPWGFATMMSADFTMEPMVTLIEKYNVKKMVIMVDAKYNYAVYQGKLAYKIAKRMGVEVLHKEGRLDVESGWADFTPRVTQIKALEPQLICAVLFPRDLAHLAVALNSAGISAKSTPCFGSLMVQPDMVVAGGEAAEGWYGSADYLVGGETDPVQADWEEKLTAYAKIKSNDPGVQKAQTNTACGYDAAVFLCEAIKRAKITPDMPLQEARMKLSIELPKLKLKTYSSKEFYWGKGGRYEKNRLVKPMYLLQVKDKKIVSAGTIQE
ncbi:MAG: ABC transporter substrate-binding protein [bacterium]|nr:ABC transporter substrate-binding protein [bacterium]